MPIAGGHSIAGIRTYPIFGLVGGLATMLEPASMWLPAGGAARRVRPWSRSRMPRTCGAARTARDHGVTTEISVIGVYLLGALACSRGVIEPMAERLVLVAGLGVVIAFLLSSKEYFHSFASKVSRDDFYATVKFLIVAVIALPLLPDRDVGPLDAINPRNLGLMVVTISGLSFLGYVAMRLWGAKRGLLLGAALGGLVSSTAVTLSFANRTKADPRLAPVAAGAIAVAWTIMLGRVAVLVALIDAELLQLLAFPLVAMILAALVGLALTFHRNAGQEPSKTELTNPFELGSAIKVSLMFALVLVVTKGAIHYLGDRGALPRRGPQRYHRCRRRDRVDGEASRLPGQCPGRDHGDLHRHRGQHAGQDRARGGASVARRSASESARSAPWTVVAGGVALAVAAGLA
jgi:uncharacterized membrane protein (DUF4010 family)